MMMGNDTEFPILPNGSFLLFKAIKIKLLLPKTNKSVHFFRISQQIDLYLKL